MSCPEDMNVLRIKILRLSQIIFVLSFYFVNLVILTYSFHYRPYIKIKKRKRQISGIDTINTQPETPYGKVTKTQENITYKRANRAALSQQVITKLQGDKTAS